ncbi:MAG: hypothetical protein ACE14W_05475 [Candidatus Velamenicoccus archaeovorus]
MSDDAKLPTGSLAQEKRGDTSDPGHPQPSEPEVESARLLANDAREQLEGDGIGDDRIRRLADEFIARDLGEGVPEFVAWARRRLREGPSAS